MTEQKNVLITDPYQRTCYLVKSILLGGDYRVSIGTNWTTSLKKLGTGLFDLLFVDVESPEEAQNVRRYIIEGSEWKKYIPLGIITSKEDEHIKKCEPEVIIKKPVRINQVLSAVETMCEIRKARYEKLKEDFRRTTVECELKLDEDDDSLTCRAVSLNPLGMLTEPNENNPDRMKQFHEFFKNTGDREFLVELEGEEDPFEVQVRKIFQEQTPDEKIREVGFQISQGQDKARRKLQDMLNVRAPGGSGAEGT